MKKKLFSILLYALSFSFGFAQTSQVIDSLKHELTIAKQDTTRVDILVDLCRKYWGINPDSSLKYGQQSLALSKEIHFYKDVHTLLEDAKEMKTNHIVHATQENLPVYLHN